MSPKSNDRIRDIRSKSISKITRTAFKLFATRGYHTTSIEAIAKKANISKGLIYNYFKSKEDLLESIIFGEMYDMEKNLIRVFDQRSPQKKLEFFFESMLTLVLKDKEYWFLFWSTFMQPRIPKRIRSKMSDTLHKLIDLIGTILQENGYKKPKQKAMLLAAQLDGLFLYYVFDTQKFPAQSLIDNLKKEYIKNSKAKDWS